MRKKRTERWMNKRWEEVGSQVKRKRGMKRVREKDGEERKKERKRKKGKERTKERKAICVNYTRGSFENVMVRGALKRLCSGEARGVKRKYRSK